MKNQAIFWVTCLGAATVVPLIQVVAIAKTAIDINAVAKSITVMISEPNSRGSGVIIQHQGDTYTVITAAHVVKKKGVAYSLVTADGQKYSIINNSIRRATTDIDLAVVKFRANVKYPVAKLGNSNNLVGGTDLYVAGYPLPTAAITETVFMFRTGTVSANSDKTFEKGYSLVYSNDTLPGMSGGAVLNQEGELVAIHGRTDREKNSNGDFGGKTGFSLGIPINRFGMIASSLGVALEQKLAAIPQTTSLKADDYFALAVGKFTKGDYQGALSDYDRAIAINPQYVAAYSDRGSLKYYKLNDFQGALSDYDRAITIDPQYESAYIGRGNLKSDKLNDPQGALSDFNRAIAIDPQSNLGYMARATLKWIKLNDIQGAIADFDRAIAIDPQLALAYAFRGNLKTFGLNDSQGALADFNRAIAIDPQSFNAYMLRGNLKSQKLNDFQGALADFNRTISIDPQSAFAYINRGDLKLQKLNDSQGALADFNRAIAIDPQLDSAYVSRGNLKNLGLNDSQGALADFNRAISINPQSITAYNARGILKYQKGERAGGINDIKEAIKLARLQGNSIITQQLLDILQSLGVSE